MIIKMRKDVSILRANDLAEWLEKKGYVILAKKSGGRFILAVTKSGEAVTYAELVAMGAEDVNENPAAFVRHYEGMVEAWQFFVKIRAHADKAEVKAS